MASKAAWQVAAAVALLTVGLACGYGAGAQDTPNQGAKNTLQPNQVMRIGDKVITAEQLIARIWDQESVMPERQRVLVSSLTYLRDTSLLDLEAARQKLTIAAEEQNLVTTQQLDLIKQRIHEDTGGMLPYEEWLKQQNLKKDEFESYVRDRARVILLKRLLVTHFEKTEESVEASHILVTQLADAKDLHRRLKETAANKLHEKFEDLAVSRSEDPSAGVTKGLLPRLFRHDGTLVKEAEDAIWALKDGEYSEPVKTSYGYHIFKRNRTFTPARKSLDEMRGELMKSPDVAEENFNRWVRWVFNTQKYPVQRRLPGYDCKPDQPIK